MTRRPLCGTCIHYNLAVDKKKPSCKAFPEGIPFEIFMERVLHYNKIKNQNNNIVYEPRLGSPCNYDSLRSRVKDINKNRLIFEAEINHDLRMIVNEKKLDLSNIKLIAYWLQYQNESDLFWPLYRKTKIYIVQKTNNIIELEVDIDSNFVRKAYALLLLENFNNHNSSMHIHLKKDNSYQIYYTTEHRESGFETFLKDRIYLRGKEDYEKIKKLDLYKGCSSIDEAEKRETIKEIISRENKPHYLIRTYYVFLYFYVRNILVTPTEINKIRSEIKDIVNKTKPQ